MAKSNRNVTSAMEYYNLPETRAQTAEYLFLYETSGGEE